MTIWSTSPQHIGTMAERAARALQKGKVLICPTDTVYGLIADATNRKAVQKVFVVKKREQGKPLPVFVKDIAMAKRLAKVSPLQERFLKKVWPGKVTVVLPSKDRLPKELGASQTIGLRIPRNELIQHILEKFGKPLTGTSANVSGTPSLSDSKEIMLQFKTQKHTPDILVDAGKLPFSRPSTVIDITKEKPVVLRT